MEQYRDYWQYNNNASQLNINSCFQKHWIIQNFHKPELFNSFWIYWTLCLLSCFMDLWISTIFTRIIDFSKEHSETRTPESFITITKQTPNSSMVVLIIFIPWTFLQYFLKWERKYMNNRWNWTIGWFFHGIFSQGTQAKVPKPH